LITIIGVLVSAFLLASYYAILSKYCGNSESSRRVENQQPSLDEEEEEEESDHPDTTGEHEPWVISTPGLDEGLIKSITQVKYKKRNGLVGSIDCSVCLGEFQDDESLRLLPKCSHAFHVDCIDTWLRSHSNCPLCRASIFSATTQPPQPPRPVVADNNNQHHPPQEHQPSTQIQTANEHNRSVDQEEANSRNLPKSPFQGSSDLGLHEEVQGHTVRRSISMDHCHETRLLISEALRFYSKDANAGESSKSIAGGGGVSSSFSNEISGNEVLNCGINSVAMKRSFSSGRFLFMTKHTRGRNSTIPL